MYNNTNGNNNNTSNHNRVQGLGLWDPHAGVRSCMV